MNKFFKSAIERYKDLLPSNKKGGYLINPISEVDAEIINEIKVILDKLGVCEVSEILKNYKEFKDLDIYESLLQWNIDNPKLKFSNNSQDQESSTIGVAYIKIKNIVMFQYEFRCYELFEEIEDDDVKYKMILNPTPPEASKVPIFANYIVTFDDEDDRSDTINRLILFLEERGINFVEL